VVSGGVSKDSLSSNKVYEYNPVENKFEVLESMIEARHSHASIVFNDSIYVIGG
jgi:hypothetical protein